jgi:cyclopropane-fatty-acyl-phospholipid synthase
MASAQGSRPAGGGARTLWAWSDRREVQLPAARGVFAAQGGAALGVKVLCSYRLDGGTRSGTLRGAQSDGPFTRDSMYKENIAT